ncbi:hypothetical protein OIDMADRAFT_60322 [Oidiodendron maius Zn]|uniref:Uncharacterized protein n=1 Tax=Oidiodendron maius (strain Zn) TaxID=913774 RepID=A0A0C3GT22_OIDMZ|nr:hypothetical protein OIDMADRAFT_60322 [Oidiodendron maius Zn]
MGSIPNLVSVVLLLLWSADSTAADSLFGDIISAARKFTGGLAPVVELDYGKFQGVGDNITGTCNYLGIAPTLLSDNRIDRVNEPLLGIQDVSDYRPACPQHETTSVLAPNDLGLGAFAGAVEALLSQPVLRESEDCLNINVQVPKISQRVQNYLSCTGYKYPRDVHLYVILLWTVMEALLGLDQMLHGCLQSTQCLVFLTRRRDR